MPAARTVSAGCSPRSGRGSRRSTSCGCWRPRPDGVNRARRSGTWPPVSRPPPPRVRCAPRRRAIAGDYRDRYDLDVAVDNVVVTTGSSGGFLLSFLSAFDVGSRVGLARPGYPAYRNILHALGCEVVDLQCGPDTRYQPTVDMVENLRLDGLIVASPANPTGTMLEPGELASLATWCATTGVRLISD